MLRHFGELVSGKDTNWLPHVPVVHAPAEASEYVYASQFANTSHSLWTIVNRNLTDSTPETFRLSLPCTDGDEFYDLFSGVALSPENSADVDQKCVGGKAILAGVKIQPGGLGSVLRVKVAKPTAPLAALLKQMKNLTTGVVLEKLNNGVPLEDAPMDFHVTAIPPGNRTPPGMVRIPGEPAWRMIENGNEIEGDPMPAWLDVWYPWEILGGGKTGRTHSTVINIPEFFIDKTPGNPHLIRTSSEPKPRLILTQASPHLATVTNDDYAAFLKKTNWKPNSTQNWIKHWEGKTTPP